MPTNGQALGFYLSLIASMTFAFSTCCLQVRKNERHHSLGTGVGRMMTSQTMEGVLHLTDIDRVLCISDLHVDHADNMQWLANHTGLVAEGVELCNSDLVIVAGDISHDLERIEQCFSYLQRRGPSILFVPGNHEAWLKSSEIETGNSIQKLQTIYELCDRMGVITDPVFVGNTKERPHGLCIVPLESWYDGTLSVKNLEDLCHDFGRWPWVDFIRCRWPGFPSMESPNKKIPRGLAQFFFEKNIDSLNKVKAILAKSDSTFSPGLMTVSHFLPNQQCLPDWKNVSSSRFDRDSWLDHGGAETSAKFAKVSGTRLLDDQIRSFELPNSARHIHLFGHSHRPKDFEKDNIRYVHNPLGKPREREIRMVSPEVDFQPVWHTFHGELPGETIIRYWEEKGGGVEALRRRMKSSRRKNRYGKKHLKLHRSESNPKG
eukprot:scaffold24801_cov181-Cylindrotheca_fusiformis.AAC.11